MQPEPQEQREKQRGRPFQPGQSGNPGGRPIGSRNKLQGDFMRALADDFAVHGPATLERVREEDPAAYIRVCASLMPKELEIKQPLDEISDEQLDAAAVAVRAILAAQAPGSGAGEAAEVESAQDVRAVPQTG